MRLLLNEIKKLFSVKVILLLVVVNVLLFKFLMEFYIVYFPNEKVYEQSYIMEQTLIPIYGAKINEKHVTDYISRSEQFKQEAEDFLTTTIKERFQVQSYESLWYLSQNNLMSLNENDEALLEKGVNYFWKLQMLNSTVNDLDMMKRLLEASKQNYNGAASEVIQQQINENYIAFYNDQTLANFKSYAMFAAITIFINVILLIGLFFIKDKRQQVLALQYVTKTGRKTYRVKWLAGFISAMLVVVLLLFVYFTLYTKTNTNSYADIPLWSFSSFYWFDITYGQYMLISLSAIFIFALLLATVLMAISNIVTKPIVLIVIHVVTLFLAIWGIAINSISKLFELNTPQNYTLILAFVLLVISVIGNLFVYKVEMKKDII